jgi:hypothetical protein
VDPTTARSTLAGLRFAIGGGAWVAPRLAGTLFGLSPARNPQSPYLARLFGVRDAALGAGVLQSEGAAQKQWLQLGVACDVADAVAALAGGRAGYLSPPVTALVFAPAVAAAALGVLALREPPAAPPAA